MAEYVITASVPASVPVSLDGTVAAVNAETFNGNIPGPTIRAVVGETITVRLVNNLPYPVGIHWHGIELENYADGTEVTQNPVPGGTFPNGATVGGTFLYRFKVPKPGIFWYHPHHDNSTNRTFRGLYGMLIVTETALENTLFAANKIPDPPMVFTNTHALVLSDITVCQAVNAVETYDYYAGLPVADRPEWLAGGAILQNGPSPQDLCQLEPLDNHGHVTMPLDPFGPGEIPNNFRMDPPVPLVPLTVEGQIVLTNGRNVGYRRGTPAAPGALEAGYSKITVQPGQGLRFQVLNAATTRYFRLKLTAPGDPGNPAIEIPLLRIGGEGGILNTAILEGDMTPIVSKYEVGEILIPAGSRADIIAKIPPGIGPRTFTLWTRDFQRTGASWAQLPTVPVLHIDVAGVDVLPLAINAGTVLKVPATPVLGAAVATPFLNPATIGKTGFPVPNGEIVLSAGGGMNGINSVNGHFDHVPYTDPMNGHIGSTRYAKFNDILQFTVRNDTFAHHPFHLHGFSFQPIELTVNGSAPGSGYSYPVEYRDNLDIPGGHTLRLKVHISPRELADGMTPGGAYGRWLFHCHIFFHAHHGMISELVITDPDGKEKPNVNVNGSWAFAPSGMTTTRTGTWSHPDGPAAMAGVMLTESTGTGTLIQNMDGTWSWTSGIGPDTVPPHTFVYITATDALGRQDQCVFRLQVGPVGTDEGSDNGDPHIHTVGGKRYDFQAAGEFVALRDRDGMEVQTRQTPVLTANPIEDPYTGIKACVSLNTAVAARVGSHRIAYQPAGQQGQLQFYVDGRPVTLTTQGLSLDGNRVSGFMVDGSMALRVDYVHSAVLIVTPRFWNSHNMWYMNVNVAHTHADEGIMGRIPKDSWLPLLSTGASVGPKPAGVSERFNVLYKTFADSWRVTDQSSLFVYAKGTSTATFTDKDWPAGEPPCNLKPQFVLPGVAIPQGMPVAQAQQICQVVTDPGLNQDCVFDVATTGDEEFAKGYRFAQELRERASAVQVVSLEPGELTAIVTRLIGKEPPPKGKVTFYVDDKPAGPPVETDGSGHARWDISGQGGAHTFRAIFTPDDSAGYSSNSPDLEIAPQENSANNGNDGNTGKEGLTQRWYFWFALLLLLIFLIWLLT